MTTEASRDGLLRALAFHQAWGYAPTEVELIASWDRGSNAGLEVPEPGFVWSQLRMLLEERVVFCLRGRIFFSGQEGLVREHERREALFPRKIRRAKRVVRWLARVRGVRFVALCNTTALAHAREMGDLDFFVVTRERSLWQTRGLAALPFKFLGLRPGATGEEARDAICLSFFIDETALDLTSLQLEQDDPYFHHWFLSLVPLMDDGVGERLWKSNQAILQRHPLACRWRVHPELGAPQPLVRVPFFSGLESLAKRPQQRRLPMIIQKRMNQATDVVVNDHILKLHTTDNRQEFCERYYAICEQHGIRP